MISCVTVPDSPVSDPEARDVQMTSVSGQKMSFVPIKDEHGGPSHPAILPPPHPDSSHMTSSGMVMSHHNDNNNGIYPGTDNGNLSHMRTPPPDLISDTLPKVRIDLPSHETAYRSENHAMTSIPKSEYHSRNSSMYHHHGHHQRHGSSSHHHRKGGEQISPQQDVKFQPLQVDTNMGHHLVQHHGKMAQISPSAGQQHSCHASHHHKSTSRPGTLNVNNASSSSATHHSSNVSSNHHHHHHGSMNSHSSNASHHHPGNNNSTMDGSSGNNNNSNHSKHRPTALNLGPPQRLPAAAGISQHSPTIPSLALQTGQPMFLNNNLPTELHRFELVVVEFDLITF